MKRFVSLLFLLTSLCLDEAKALTWFDGTNPVTYHTQKNTDVVVKTALSMFASDMNEVTGFYAYETSVGKAKILLYQLDKTSNSIKKQLLRKGADIQSLYKSKDGFTISISDGRIIIVGSNGRGCAYGILELSRMAGVSPWIWWGDAKPTKQERLVMDDSFKTTQSASVEYRGIFINDEDWSIREWASKTFEPGPEGQIGCNTYRRIFELLLRLRANAIWPAMHPGTVPFFQVPGAKAVADSCGIVIGTSHCEPMLRNNVGEWDEKTRGKFNYFTNRQAVKDYWTERLEEVKLSHNNMFTIGMRGIHDGNMEGAKTTELQLSGLQQVIDDQQELLREHIGNPEQQMQVFVPYKEVLQVYENGLKVPDYVTLMWCDDNYGYMTRLSNAEEQKRKGGAGVYYHLSYWGRPHDYLWLTTTQPGLIYNEMREAYAHNVRKLWIANVHDPKVAGYDLELFLDLAWNINCVKNDRVDEHYLAWLKTQFGASVAEKIFPAMQNFYRLVGNRRPEFMGWSQVELDKKKYERGLSPIQDTEFSHEFGDEMLRYLSDYKEIRKVVLDASNDIPTDLHDSYFTMIMYPVCSAASMAEKILYAQMARELASDSILSAKPEIKDSICLYSYLAENAASRIISMTQDYYKQDPPEKWNDLMDFAPRRLPVFLMPPLPKIEGYKYESYKVNIGNPLYFGMDSYPVIPTDSFISSSSISEKAINLPEGARQVSMLGHSMRAISLPKSTAVTYHFQSKCEGDALLRVALIPTQPNDGGDIRFAVSVDGGEEKVFSLKEPYRSERWKLNVLRAQTVRDIPLSMTKGAHTLSIRALDDHILLDQWLIDFKPTRKYYLFPKD